MIFLRLTCILSYMEGAVKEMSRLIKLSLL